MTGPKHLDDLFPLSPLQHLMLLHALTAPRQTALLNQVEYDVLGQLDVEAFQRAWERLVARHAALRTGFLWEGLPRPLQAVRGHVALPMRIVDLGDVRDTERQGRLDELAREDAETAMPLGRAPLMRCTLARLGAEHHRFVWSIHHLVVDRWSHELLFADLASIYAALVRGDEPALGPVGGFRDYVAWLAEHDPGAAERFWRAELDGFTTPTLLAPAAGRGPTAERRSTRRPIGLAATSALRERATAWRTTLGALVLAGIGLATARRVGRDDVLVGLTVSGRPPELPGADGIVGSFVNNVPARLRLDRVRPLAEWVRELQRSQLRRQPFEHASLRDVREWSTVPATSPLFDTLVLLNVAEPPTSAWPGVELRVRSATLDAAYPLLLAATMEGAAVTLSLIHDASFPDPDALLAELADALAAITAAPAETLVGDLLPEVAPSAASSGGHAAAHIREVAVAGRSSGPVDADALLALWRDVLGVEVGLDDDFFAVGGTSLQALELFVRLERLLGRAMPLSTLFEAGTVRGLLAELGRPVGPVGSIVRIRSSGSRTPIVAVPGVGGDAVTMAGLARALGADQPFIALQSPGLDGREPPLKTIEDTADHFVGQLRAVEDRPVHLMGVCWGAAVAFEMARRLQDAGRPPAGLALIDPSVLVHRHDGSGGSAEAAFLRSRLELYWSEMRDADWRKRGQFIAGRVKRAAAVIAGSEVREESKAELNRFRVERANRDAISQYEPQPYHGEVTMFLSSGWDFGAREDPRFEWARAIEPAPRIVYVPGINAGDIISPANVRGFAAMLREWLDAAAEPAVPG